MNTTLIQVISLSLVLQFSLSLSLSLMFLDILLWKNYRLIVVVVINIIFVFIPHNFLFFFLLLLFYAIRYTWAPMHSFHFFLILRAFSTRSDTYYGINNSIDFTYIYPIRFIMEHNKNVDNLFIIFKAYILGFCEPAEYEAINRY